MPANTSEELSSNTDSPFHSPASPLQAINPPPVNSVSAPAAAPQSTPTAGQTPTPSLAHPEPSPGLIATSTATASNLGLELQIQRVIDLEVQKAVAKAMSAMLPTMPPHFTVSSPSSVASTHGATNETVIIPRADTTQNTATSPLVNHPPSTVAPPPSTLVNNNLSQPQSTTAIIADDQKTKLIHTRNRIQVLDQQLATHRVKLTDIARINDHLLVLTNPNSKIEEKYGNYYESLWEIPYSMRTKDEKEALKRFDLASFPSYRNITSRIDFRMWLNELLYYKMQYFVPDLILGGLIQPAADKTLDNKIIQAARVAIQTLDDLPMINWQVLVDILIHLDRKVNIFSLETQLETHLNSSDYVITKISAIHGLVNLRKHDINIKQWLFIWKLIFEHLPSLMEHVLATTKSSTVRSTLGEINYTPRDALDKLTYQKAKDFIPVWDIAIVALKEKAMLLNPFEESDSISTSSKSTTASKSSSTTKNNATKPNNRSGLQCTCCGRKFHDADSCRILVTLIKDGKVKHKDGKYTSVDGKTNYKLEQNQSLIHTYPEQFPKPDNAKANADKANARP